MCLLERQTPSFSPPGVWDSLQQYLSLNKQAIHAKRRRTACLSACCIFSEWENSEREPPQSSCFVNILCCYCISNAWIKSPIEGLEHHNHNPVSNNNLHMNKFLYWNDWNKTGVIFICVGAEVIWRAVSQQQRVQNLETQMVSQVLQLEHCWFIYD